MRRFVFLAVLLLACTDSSGPSPDDARLYPAEVWAGNEVFLAGDWYRTMTPSVFADGLQLPVRRVNDSTIAATLPDSIQGTVTITESGSRGSRIRGTVEVHGFARRGTISVPISTDLVPWIGPGQGWLVAGDTGGVAIIRPAEDAATHFPGVNTNSCCWFNPRSPGSTYLPGRYLLFDFPNLTVNGWSLLPVPVLTDTAPISANFRLVAQLSPDVWLTGGPHEIETLNTATSTPRTFTLEGPRKTVISPSGDRAVVLGYSATGSPVLNAQDGALAWVADSAVDVLDAGFTLDGQILYLWTQSGVRAYSAGNGDSLGVFAGFGSEEYPMALAVDPVGSVVYFATDSVENLMISRVKVHVLERGTLRPIGTMASFRYPTICRAFCVGASAVSVDPVTSQILVTVWTGVNEVSVFHFSRPSSGL